MLRVTDVDGKLVEMEYDGCVCESAFAFRVDGRHMFDGCGCCGDPVPLAHAIAGEDNATYTAEALVEVSVTHSGDRVTVSARSQHGGDRGSFTLEGDSIGKVAASLLEFAHDHEDIRASKWILDKYPGTASAYVEHVANFIPKSVDTAEQA